MTDHSTPTWANQLWQAKKIMREQGVCQHRMHNEGGGVTTPLVYGHVPKRELYNALRAYLTGLEQRKEQAA